MEGLGQVQWEGLLARHGEATTAQSIKVRLPAPPAPPPPSRLYRWTPPPLGKGLRAVIHIIPRCVHSMASAQMHSTAPEEGELAGVPAKMTALSLLVPGCWGPCSFVSIATPRGEGCTPLMFKFSWEFVAKTQPQPSGEVTSGLMAGQQVRPLPE